MMNEYVKPRLIEPGVRYFFNASLDQCRKFKYRYYNLYYNIMLLISFISVISITLYFKYKHKQNRKAKEEQKRKEKEYLLSKLNMMDEYKKNQVSTMMTDLPLWQDNPEVQFYNNRKMFV